MQPAEQRREVHRPKGARSGSAPPSRTGPDAWPSASATTASASPPRSCPRLRPVHPGRPVARPGPGGAGHRPDPGPDPGGDARRNRSRPTATGPAGERVRRPAAAGRPRPTTAPTRIARRPPGRHDQTGGAHPGGRRQRRLGREPRPAPPLLGHEVRLAHDGPSALDAARSTAPDVVLLDIGLPGMDGYEVARQLRQEPVCARHRAGRPVRLRPGDRPPATRDAGFDDHLIKPVDTTLLRTLLGSIEQRPRVQ